MSAWPWRAVGPLDRDRLRAARLQAHDAVQWLARFARAYVPPRPDDSHTNLGWDDWQGGFVTHAIAGGTRMTLRVADLTLALLDARGEGPPFNLDGCTDSDARAWLGHALKRKGLDARKLDDPSPYEMPAGAIARGAAYSTVRPGRALQELAAWFANADGLLGDVREKLAARGFDPPPVRCWPHHFDLDSLLSLGGDRTTGIGFSPGDEYYDDPYFYVTIYPEPDRNALPALPAVGHWHTHEFVAAVAPASKIVAVKDQKKDAEAFVVAGVTATMKLLDR